MEDKENDFLDIDFDGIEEYTPEGGFDLEEILSENISDSAKPERAPAPEKSGRRRRGRRKSEAPMKDEPKPENSQVVPDETNTGPENDSPEDAASTEAPPNAEPEADAGDAVDGAAARPDEDSTLDEAGGLEAAHDEDEPPEDQDGGQGRSIPSISVKSLAMLACVALGAVLVCAALRFELKPAAFYSLVAGGIGLTCLPMVFMSLDAIREKNRVPAPIMMLLAVAVLAASGGVVDALVTAVFFNIVSSLMVLFFRRQLMLTSERLETKAERLEQPLSERIDELLLEVSYERVRPIVKRRELERFVALGVVILALAIGVVVPVIDGMSFTKWLGRAAALLAVCAYTGEAEILMTILSAAETGAGDGIYFAGSAAMNAATEVTSVLFNKSGTLTDGNYRITNVDPVRLTRDQVLFLAAYAGAWSDHPLARTIREESGVTPDKSRVSRHMEREGLGTVVFLDGQIMLAAGNIELMEELGVKGDMYIPGETCVFVAVDKVCVGRIDLSDELKPDAVTVVHELRRLRVANVAMMTGDNALNATNTGRRVGIAEVYSDCKPSDKAERLQYILDSQERDDRLLAVSSAGRDRELLEMANLSATLGMGGDVTGSFPDIVIASGKLDDLTRAIRIAKRARADLTASFAAAVGARVICAVLAVCGVLGLWSVTALMLATDLVTFLISFVSDR